MQKCVRRCLRPRVKFSFHSWVILATKAEDGGSLEYGRRQTVVLWIENLHV
jgi:hypothetical protein